MTFATIQEHKLQWGHEKFVMEGCLQCDKMSVELLRFNGAMRNSSWKVDTFENTGEMWRLASMGP